MREGPIRGDARNVALTEFGHPRVAVWTVHDVIRIRWRRQRIEGKGELGRRSIESKANDGWRAFGIRRKATIASPPQKSSAVPGSGLGMTPSSMFSVTPFGP